VLFMDLADAGDGSVHGHQTTKERPTLLHVDNGLFPWKVSVCNLFFSEGAAHRW
jgi:hypothetical protein